MEVGQITWYKTHQPGDQCPRLGVMLPDRAGADSHGQLQQARRVQNATTRNTDADGLLLKPGSLLFSLDKLQGGRLLAFSLPGLCILISGLLTCILFVA